ncbi:MAG: hypothetical protein QXI37_03675, partial [Thermoprotei archaeon]
MSGLRASARALSVLSSLAAKVGELEIILDDQGCCGYSNVFVSKAAAGRIGLKEFGEVGNAKVYVDPRFASTLGESPLLDVVESY